MSKTFARTLIVDAVMAALAITWLVGGITGAGSVFQVVFWVLQPLAAIGMLTIGDDELNRLRVNPFALGWFYGYSLGIMALLAWFGHPIMAGIVMVKILLLAAVMAKRHIADKAAQ